jgi:hypothetical protein
MAYEGDVMTVCGLVQFDFKSTSIVAVSGASWNQCGHLLVHSEAAGGLYFHVAGDAQSPTLIGKIHAYPRYMNDANYRRYLKENGKRELRRRSVTLRNPRGAEAYVERALAEKWTWGVLPNNCVAFVESVIAAGEGEWSSWTNCPTIATEDTFLQRMEQFFRNMDRGIRGQYGLPNY